jgi:Uri superfamily endonuclease
MATAEDSWLGNNLIERFPGRPKGSYVLLMELPEEQTITVGSLSDVRFSAGFYAYVGSAMGGIKSRLGYHLRRGKKRHWHIDYLLEKATIVDIDIGETRDRSECALARALSSQFDSIPGFGSSDCRCRSHLFFDTDEGRIRAGIKAAIASLSVLPARRVRV